MKYYLIKLLLTFHFVANCLLALTQNNTGKPGPISQKFFIHLNGVDAVERLSQSIRFPTVSYHDTALVMFEPYLAFIDFLEHSYPLVHQHLKKKIINRYSLLYIWQGLDTSLLPSLFLA